MKNAILHHIRTWVREHLPLAKTTSDGLGDMRIVMPRYDSYVAVWHKDDSLQAIFHGNVTGYTDAPLLTFEYADAGFPENFYQKVRALHDGKPARRPRFSVRGDQIRAMVEIMERG